MSDSPLLATMRAAFPMVEWKQYEPFGEPVVAGKYKALWITLAGGAARVFTEPSREKLSRCEYATDAEAPAALRRALAEVVAMGDAAKEVLG